MFSQGWEKDLAWAILCNFTNENLTVAFVCDVVTGFVFNKLSQVILAPLPLNTFSGYKIKEATRWSVFNS